MYDPTISLMNARRVLITAAVTGAALASPLGVLIWVGAEHGGGGPLLTPLYTSALGAAAGLLVGTLVLVVRAVWRRASQRRTA